MAAFPSNTLLSPLALPSEHAMDMEDRACFSRFYERQAPRIHRFLRDLLGDSSLAHDATQETFVRAYAHMNILRDTERAVPWVFGVARHVSLEMRKARAQRGRVFADHAAAATQAERVPCASSGCPEGGLLDREALSIIDAALAQLSEERRAMLLLSLDHGIEYTDIATLMGFSLARVKVEIFRAREVLRSTLAAYEREADQGAQRASLPAPAPRRAR